VSEQKFFSASKAAAVRVATDGSPKQGDGQSKRLYVGRNGSYDYDAYIEFTCDWTNVSQIASAYLVFYTDDYSISSLFTLPNSSAAPKATVKRLTSAFTEGNNPDGTFDTSDYTAPSSTTSDQVVTKPSRAAQELVRVNITEIVEDFAPKSVKRHDSGTGGFAAGSDVVRVGIFGTSDRDEDFALLSDKFADATYRPKIELNYTLGKTTPSTPTNLTPASAVASIGGFQADFSDVKPTDKLSASQVEVFGTAHNITGISLSDLITCSSAHGLHSGDIIYFTSLTGGSGLSTFTKYYVISSGLTTTSFKVSTTHGGSAVNVTNDFSAGTWRSLLWDSGTKAASLVEILNGRSDVTPEFTAPHGTTIVFRIRQRDNEGLWSAWTGLASFSVTNTDPTLTGLSPAGLSYATLDGVHFKGTYADAESDRFAAYQVQLSAYAQGDAHWDDPEFILWDTGKQYVGATPPKSGSGAATRVIMDTTYGGSSLAAGAYFWRARVWDSKDGVSTFVYAAITLTADFQADPEQAAQQIQLRPRAPWRIVIKNMGALRGPGTVVAILENAKNPGASLMYNSPGEAHWTLAVDHPQISVIEPKETHYSIQFYTGDGWREKFAGLVWDFDANERDVVFYGIDYLALYDYVMDERYDPANPDKPYTKGGSKYVDKTINTVVTSSIDYAKNLTNSPVGFITRGSIATMDEKVTIFSTFIPTLQLLTGLLDSHRGGADKRTRVQVRPKTGGGYEIVVQDNPGVTRTNLRMRYGELVQGYRTVAFGKDWATRINAIGRQRDGVMVSYEKATGGISESVYGRFAKATVMTDIEDRLDLRRRAKRLAMASGMLGQQMGLGLRTGVLGPRDGYDVTDKFPISIQHGAVNTDNFGHDGLWVCLGVTWEGGGKGEQTVILSLRPPDAGSAPSASLLDSVPISPQAEWQLGWKSPNVLNATSKYWRDATTGKVYIRDGYGTPVSITGSH
jgi:hypothetical protein